MQGKAESGEKAQCTWEYMSPGRLDALSRFPTQHGAARDFFNSLLRLGGQGQGQGLFQALGVLHAGQTQ